MKKRVYFQMFGPAFHGDYVFAAYEGLIHDNHINDYEINFYTDIKEVPVNFNTMVVGCIEDTRYYLEALGVKVPPAMNIPKKLEVMLGRYIEIMTVEKLLNTTFDEPFFVKPVDLKRFPAGVIQKNSSKRSLFAGVPLDALVLYSDWVDVVNEYRVFINRGRIIGIKQYGMVGGAKDHFSFPDGGYVMRCVELMNEELDTPISYTLDVMTVRGGGTEFIECNDGWSVGSYGLDGELYWKFLCDRWNELIKTPKAVYESLNTK